MSYIDRSLYSADRNFCASTTVIAHEIGHAFQVRDIYPVKYLDGRVNELVNSLVNITSVELDWNNGVGTRYYKLI